jgi:hypothetical protein
MYAQIAVAVLLIPYGLSGLMRANDALTAGRMGAGEAGTLSVAGMVMILSGLALLVGVLVAGVPALAALGASTVVWVRQRRRSLPRLGVGELAARLAVVGLIAAMILITWR